MKDFLTMALILIIYHSQGGSTRAMAEAAAEGVNRVQGAEALLKHASDADISDLLRCDGILIGSPEYFGYMAGAVKDFFDRTFKDASSSEKVFRKPYAVLVKADNDGTGALNSIERICAGYKLKKVFTPVIAKGVLTEGDIEKCLEMGQTIAMGCLCGIY